MTRPSTVPPSQARQRSASSCSRRAVATSTFGGWCRACRRYLSCPPVPLTNGSTRNANGDTPVIVAAIWNQQAVLRYLIEAAKADPCLKNEMGFTAMHMAAREWNQEVCEYICKVAPECARIRDNVRRGSTHRVLIALG